MVPSFLGVAKARAPALAGTLLSYQLGYSSVMLMCALASGAALFIYLRVYQVLLRLDPDLADAD